MTKLLIDELVGEVAHLLEQVDAQIEEPTIEQVGLASTDESRR